VLNYCEKRTQKTELQIPSINRHRHVDTLPAR